MLESHDKPLGVLFREGLLRETDALAFLAKWSSGRRVFHRIIRRTITATFRLFSQGQYVSEHVGPS
jgi:hypothetical protein